MRTSRSEQSISRTNSLLSLSAVQAAQGHILEARMGMEEAIVILEHLKPRRETNHGSVQLGRGLHLAG